MQTNWKPGPADAFDGLDVARIGQVKTCLAPHDLHVLIYVRNPLGYMHSSYKQRIKMGTYRKSFGTFVSEQAGRLDYGALVDRWATVLGPERVHLRLFDKVKVDPGLEADFCGVIGADFEPLRDFVDKPANVSPPDLQIEMMRRINRLTWWAGDTQRRRGWPARLRAQVGRSGMKGHLVRAITGIGLPDALVSHAEIDRLRDLVSHWLDPFLDRYVAPEDRDLLRF
ncbi:hypothetical protein GQ464_004305 [Rhodocaloribacter litoris]|uniref:hypothetical protein n=1 Tax=Rhodocaloribacter litoris TaxID=2558931 RepID=UPI001422E33D|nr:hypothetical protein [Rhodocaloribacter litoris]QXD16182.1 hypothetical protein GQ464_004305 [Rhodocaloribacter litoris]